MKRLYAYIKIIIMQWRLNYRKAILFLLETSKKEAKQGIDI